VKKNKLPNDTYLCDIYFISGTVDELNRFANKNFTLMPKEEREFKHSTGARFISYENEMGFYAYYIFFIQSNRFTRAFEDSCIAHECDHCVNAIFADKGIHFDLENDEHHAYFLQWLLAACLFCLRGKK
jgi:hypothetical protein